MIRLRQNLLEMDAVIFDLGNVLLDYDPFRFMRLLNIDPAIHKRIAKALFGNPIWCEIDRGTMTEDELAEAAGDLDPEIREEIRFYMRNWSQFFYLIPENVETFYRIKETGTKVYVLSNFSEATYRKMTAAYSFLNHFDGGVVSYQDKLIKPDPAIYHLLIERCGLDPKRSVFIDDLEPNIKTALQLGFNAIWHNPAKPIAPYFVL